MRIYISTCDKYDHLLPCQAYLLNKFWPGQEVHVLGFRQPPELPPNFTFHSMEPVETVPWSTNMRKFFETVDDHHFVFLFDDYFLVEKVDEDKIKMMENLLVDDKLAKADLSMNTMSYSHTNYKGLTDKFLSNSNAFLRLSTQAAIWTKEFWLKWMNPGLSPWQFEISQNSHDDELIVGTNGRIFINANISNCGKIMQPQVDVLPMDAKKEFFVPIDGQFGKGKFSNVVREKIKEGIRCVTSLVGENAFIIRKTIVTSIYFSKNKIQVRYDCRNDNGITIRQDVKTFTVSDFEKFVGPDFKEGLSNIYQKLSDLVSKYCTCCVENEKSIRFVQYDKNTGYKSLNVTGGDFVKMVGESFDRTMNLLSESILECG